MKLTVLGCGRIFCDRGLLFEGAVSREMTYVPVTCFVIEHPDGVLLWDTGMNRAVRTDAIGHWGGVAKRTLVPELGEGEDVVERLAEIGMTPDHVDLVINSHLHNDHCGMNTYFPSSRVLIREREYEHAHALMDQPSSGFIRGDFYGDNAHFELIEYDDEYDVFGDGAVVLISTVGHTPGHQCLKVTFRSGTAFVLSGDAVYTHEQLCTCTGPGISWDAEAVIRSVQHLDSLARAGARVIVAHDPGSWDDLGGFRVLHEEPS